jgi:hypothetical protein
MKSTSKILCVPIYFKNFVSNIQSTLRGNLTTWLLRLRLNFSQSSKDVFGALDHQLRLTIFAGHVDIYDLSSNLIDF